MSSGDRSSLRHPVPGPESGKCRDLPPHFSLLPSAFLTRFFPALFSFPARGFVVVRGRAEQGDQFGGWGGCCQAIHVLPGDCVTSASLGRGASLFCGDTHDIHLKESSTEVAYFLHTFVWLLFI